MPKFLICFKKNWHFELDGNSGLRSDLWDLGWEQKISFSSSQPYASIGANNHGATRKETSEGIHDVLTWRLKYLK